MSSMYLYCAFQSSEEFSALDTNFMAISFFAGSSRPTAAAVTVAVADSVVRSGPATNEAPIRASRVRRDVRTWGVCTVPPMGEWVVPETVRKVSYQSSRTAYTRLGGWSWRTGREMSTV